MAMNAARAGCRQQKPGTGVDVVSRRVGAVGIEFGEPALCARQALLGSRQQPFDRLRPVAFDGVPIVVQAAVIEDAEIELRGSLAAFGSESEVPHRAGFQRALRSEISLAAKPLRESAFPSSKKGGKLIAHQHRSHAPASANRSADPQVLDQVEGVYGDNQLSLAFYMGRKLLFTMDAECLDGSESSPIFC